MDHRSMNHQLSPRNRQMFQPATALWNRYHPETAPYAFHSESAEEATQWQEKTRRALGERLGFLNDPVVDPNAIELSATDKGDYLRVKMVMDTAAHTTMPFYLLTPRESAGPHPVVLALAGHGYGVADIVGLWEDGSERDTPDGYHKDFAVALCRQGFAVVAPEISCFGERQTDYGYLDRKLGQPVPTTCEHTAALALHQGGSVVGLRVRDGLRLVDYLETRADLDTGRLGCMGISGGGMHTLFSTCMDRRIKASVISGYFSTFRDSILAMHHCPCNFVHGLAEFGEMADLAGLIAPRPLFVESGNHDPIFPREAVEQGLSDARKIYSVFGARDQVNHEFFEGRHRIDGPAAFGFLKTNLG